MTKPTKSQKTALELMAGSPHGVYPTSLEVSAHWGATEKALMGLRARKNMMERMVERGWVVHLRPHGYRLTPNGADQVPKPTPDTFVCSNCTGGVVRALNQGHWCPMCPEGSVVRHEMLEQDDRRKARWKADHAH